MYKNINNYTEVFKNIHNEIDKAQNIVITSHINPDGDSIGSSLALFHHLISLGKDVKIYFHNKLPSVYSFLNGLENISIIELYDDKHFETIDLLFVVDTNSKSRLGEIGANYEKIKCKKIMLDHHHLPEQIADIYCVNPNASAAGEIIYYFLNSSDKFKPSNDIYQAIYVAVMTDTGSFKFQNSTPEAHQIAAEIIKFGINPNEIYDKIYNQMEINVRRVLGYTFSNSRLYLGNKLNIAVIESSLLLHYNLSLSDLNGFSETTLEIAGVSVGVLISEVPNTNSVKVSFRSKGDIDVRSIAAKFGGGGHLNAAGATFTDLNTDEIVDLVIKEVDKLIS